MYTVCINIYKYVSCCVLLLVCVVCHCMSLPFPGHFKLN